MTKRLLGITFLLFFGLNCMAGAVNQSLYIVSDSMQTVDNTQMPYITFNQNPVFTQNSPVINLTVGDTLNLWVYNLDSTTHQFVIKDVNTPIGISAGDSISIQQVFTSEGTYIYHDPLAHPKYTYLGLAGIIVVKNHNHSCFYWNMKEHNSSWNNQLFSGGSVNWSDYNPKYFTINGFSNPAINLDTMARMTGQIGDTLYLHLANTGQSIHSIHFHGYHATIEYSSKNPDYIGREKDTFPVYPMETLTLRIVPEKSGEYPVHDHNLVAVTGNNMYPNGMFTTILITP
jgi:FtsP/CotA-like multicopper oxidase with cupredoxin domain